MNRPNSFFFSIKISVLLLLSLFSHAMTAQILVGPVVGGQTEWIIFKEKSNKDLYSTKPYVGFHAGVSISFRLQKTFFLQTSILYAQRGKSMTGKVDQSFSIDVKYQYIDMPILFNKEFDAKYKGKNYKWCVGAGPSINYWLGGKGLLNSGDLNENEINPPNYDLPYHLTFGKDPKTVAKGEMNIENPNRIQLGLNFSVGLIVEPAKLNKFMLTARYMLGHSYLSPDSKGEFGLDGKLQYKDDLQVRNQGVALSLFYFLDLNTDEKNKGRSTSKIKAKPKVKRK